MLSAAPGEVSGPIMRNTCWLTQIEKQAADERVAARARGQFTSPHFQITVPGAERNPLPLHRTGRDSGFTLSLCFLNRSESLGPFHSIRLDHI